MIDAKEADGYITDAMEASDLELERIYALRGIMGELYRLRKLKELELDYTKEHYLRVYDE